MTLQQAIDYADGLKPNAFTNDQKINWVNELEGKLQANVYHTKQAEMIRYTTVDGDKELLAAFPHDKMYWMWLGAMIDFANGDYDKYQNSMAMANNAYSEFASYEMREHGFRGTTASLIIW